MSLDLLLSKAAEDARAMVANVDAPPIEAVRRRRMWAGVAAGVAVALIVVAISVVTRALVDPEPPVVTEVTTTTIPAFELLPNALGAFPVETPLGAWTWTRIDGDESSFPTGGFFYADGRYYAAEMDVLWSSPDGFSWAREPEPLGTEMYALGTDGDDLWMSLFETERMALARWDGGQLTPVEYPQLLPEVEHMLWNPGDPQTIVSFEGHRFAAVLSTGAIDWARLFGVVPLETWDAEAGTVTLRGWNSDVPDRTLAVEIDGSALEFSDPDTGQVVLTLDLGGTDVPAEQMTSDRRAAWYLAVDTGTGFESVEPPWAGVGVDVVDLAVGSKGLVAVGLDSRSWFDPEARPVVHVWLSQDGLTWARLADIAVAPGTERVELVGNDDRLMLLGQVTDADDGIELYTSLDGESWQQVGMDFGLAFPNRLATTSYGWALTASRQFTEGTGGEEFWFETWDVWISADGLSWSRLPRAPDVTSYDLNGGMASSGGVPVGDVVFVVTSWGDGSRHFWLGKFDA